MAGSLPLRTGVELIVGRPGSGKSYYATRRVLDVIRRHRRMVYTSIPMRFPVVRRWLRVRGGERLARLIQPLTEKHFRSFLSRYGHRRKWVEEQRRSTGASACAADEAYQREHGEDVETGPEANWIPPGALIVLDEVHQWFPNPALRLPGVPAEPRELMEYLTMHRHMLHWIWCITQAQRQISPTFKSLVSLIWEVWPKADERLVGPLRFRDLGVRALAYACWPPETYSDGDGYREPPSEQFLIFHTLPWNRYVFRLYESFTHAGSRRLLSARASASVARALGPEEEEESVPSRGRWRSLLVGCAAP